MVLPRVKADLLPASLPHPVITDSQNPLRRNGKQHQAGGARKILHSRRHVAYVYKSSQESATDNSMVTRIYNAAMSGDPRAWAAIEALPDRSRSVAVKVRRGTRARSQSEQNPVYKARKQAQASADAYAEEAFRQSLRQSGCERYIP